MKTNKLLAFSLFSLLLLGFGAYSSNSALQAEKASWTDYNQSAFDQAQKEGQLVAVKFHASWCGNCKAQAKNLKALMQEDSEIGKLVVFHADFDNTKELQKKMGVNERTQILFFKDGKEVGRIQSRDKEEIRKLIKAQL